VAKEMMMESEIDQYISQFPEEVSLKLEQLRNCVKKVAPEAQECISYKMPAFKLNGILVWYAARAHHIGLYPKAAAIEVFSTELSAYKTSKGAIQLPLDEPLPVRLITEIVKYRVNENLRRKKPAK
jgi:uncharacterized protein YdhG (YjbR/CyaY superfamily)